MRYYNHLSETNEKRNPDPKIYEFEGKAEYLSQTKRMNKSGIDILMKELEINKFDDKNYYNYWFGIFRNTVSKELVLGECIWIGSEVNGEIFVNIKRCKLFNNIKDISEYLVKYAFEYDIEQAENVLANKIESTDELNDFFDI
jgi:hypothetical protein